MELSRTLISEFANMLKDDKANKLTKFYGTAVIDRLAGETYVVIDGSSDRTPVISNVAIADGNRVEVEIINHQAVITANISYPAGNLKLSDVDELSDITPNMGTITSGMIGKQGPTSMIYIDTSNGKLQNGFSNEASEFYSHAEGYNTRATAQGAHSEGVDTGAYGSGSHAEGDRCYTGFSDSTYYGVGAHAEGIMNNAIGDHSHVEGTENYSRGTYSHAEGERTETTGDASHSEGSWTKAKGDNSHAEGYHTESIGKYSHAEGYYTKARGDWSHAGGQETIAYKDYQTVFGKYNEEYSDGLFVIGAGTSDSDRKDVLWVAEDGITHIESLYINGSSFDPTLIYTKTEVNALVDTIPKFDKAFVTELPTENISETTIYFVPDPTGETGNIYTEYIYANGKWEILGSQPGGSIDNIYTKDEVDVLLTYKADLTDVYLKTEVYNREETLKLIKDNSKSGSTLDDYGIKDAKIVRGVITLGTESINVKYKAGNNVSISEDNVISFTGGGGGITEVHWKDILDVPETFTPSEHNHAIRDIIDFPKDVSHFTNDAGYLTEHQSLDNYYNRTEVDNIVDNYLLLTGGNLTGAAEIQNEYVSEDPNYNGWISRSYSSGHIIETSLIKPNEIGLYHTNGSSTVLTQHAINYKNPGMSAKVSLSFPTKDGTFALTSDIPSLNGYATESWVTDKGYIKGITKDMVVGALGYTPPTTDHTYNFSGTTFYSGDSGTAEHNANNAVKNGNYYYTSNGPATTLGASTNDGALYVQSYNDSWVGQIAQDYRNGRLFVRGKNNGTWQSWNRIAMHSEIPTSLPANGGTATKAGYVESKGDYKFDSSTLPNSFDYGISCGFVNSNSGFGSFGSVLTCRAYSGGGGSFQLYAPYSANYGGTHLKARFGNYAVSSGNSWTDLKEIAWTSDIPIVPAISRSISSTSTDTTTVSPKAVYGYINSTLGWTDLTGYKYANGTYTVNDMSNFKEFLIVLWYNGTQQNASVTAPAELFRNTSYDFYACYGEVNWIRTEYISKTQIRLAFSGSPWGGKVYAR